MVFDVRVFACVFFVLLFSSWLFKNCVYLMVVLVLSTQKCPFGVLGCSTLIHVYHQTNHTKTA